MATEAMWQSPFKFISKTKRIPNTQSQMRIYVENDETVFAMIETFDVVTSYAARSFMIFVSYISSFVFNLTPIWWQCVCTVHMCDFLVPNDWNQIKVNCDSSRLVGLVLHCHFACDVRRTYYPLVLSSSANYLSKQISLWTNAFQFVYLTKNLHITKMNVMHALHTKVSKNEFDNI